jgi:hypothetical protein
VEGAGAVVALVMLEWATGLLGAAAWTQSWKVVTRGHFKIVAWTAIALAVMTLIANRSAVAELDGVGLQGAMVIALVVAAGLYLLVQYSRTDVPGVVVGAAAAVAGVVALGLTADLIEGWGPVPAALHLVSGAALLGAVTNGMLLGHWYLNQPGLKPWALARLTQLALVSVAASGLLGLISVGTLTEASTEGAVLGIPGFGQSFEVWFFITWVVLLVFTGAVVWGARRCVKIRSIQSATGLYYVALLTAGVSEFLVRYLMVNAA